MLDEICRRNKPKIKLILQEDNNSPGIVLDAPLTSTLIREEHQSISNLLSTGEQEEKQATLFSHQTEPITSQKHSI